MRFEAVKAISCCLVVSSVALKLFLLGFSFLGLPPLQTASETVETADIFYSSTLKGITLTISPQK